MEDTKGVIRIRKSKDRQHNGQKKKSTMDKQRTARHYTDNQKIEQHEPHLKPGVNSSAPESSCCPSDIRRVTLVTKPVKRHEWGDASDKWNIYVVICDTDIP